jgi:hypothetical protein
MEPIDPDNMTEEEKRRAAHPFAAWLIIGLMVLAFLLGVLNNSQ